MHIVVATPLYPPDIEEAAVYSKEVAKRLAEKHTVTVVAYTRLPEQLPSVHVIAISKREPTFVRIAKFTLALARAARNTDLLYVQNGASVELPMTIVSLVSRAQIILHIADPVAHAKAKKSFVLHLIQQIATSRANTIFADMPLRKPEILPLEEPAAEALEKYETSWRGHISRLEHIYRHG